MKRRLAGGAGMLRLGIVGMRGRWSVDYDMRYHEYTPPLRAQQPLYHH